MKFREEKDSMGTVRVPEDAYYGAQTQRATKNFTISSLAFPSSFIKALGMIKKYAAVVNRESGLLDKRVAEAIITASEEVNQGKLADQFIVDVFQTGSGTSTNMNANEVIAGRANEIISGKRGGKSPVHPNDHVNLCQSSNDVIPSAIHISALTAINDSLIPSMKRLQKSLVQKSRVFEDIRKIGRTHLQDAIPIFLGQEFGGYARQVEMGIGRVERAAESLLELPLGGTAVGNGLNAYPNFAPRVIAYLSEQTAYPFKEAIDHFEAQAARDATVEISGALKTFAVSLIKIANDIRWLSSGPRCALGEILIPSLQPGSSIMPGKINPVIPEAILQVAAQVIGNDSVITFSAQMGNFELNVMLPVIAYNLLQSIHLLDGAVTGLTEKCVNEIKANRDKCSYYLEQSLALCTALVPSIGYDKAAEIAKEAYKSGKTVREVAIERHILPEEDLNNIFDNIIRGTKNTF